MGTVYDRLCLRGRAGDVGTEMANLWCICTTLFRNSDHKEAATSFVIAAGHAMWCRYIEKKMCVWYYSYVRFFDV